jgi:hypothetical protein
MPISGVSSYGNRAVKLVNDKATTITLEGNVRFGINEAPAKRQVNAIVKRQPNEGGVASGLTPFSTRDTTITNSHKAQVAMSSAESDILEYPAETCIFRQKPRDSDEIKAYTGSQ